MITTIKVKNFRSILNAEISLNKLTIFVGANGTGKSNIVKLLQFLSSIFQNGIETTDMEFGGMKSILPKIIPVNKLRAEHIEISYSANLFEPPFYPKDASPLSVDHKIVLSYDNFKNTKLLFEEVKFYKALAVAMALREGKEFLPNRNIIDSYITMKREHGKSDEFVMSEDITEENVDLVTEWLGIDFVMKMLKKGTGKLESVKNFIESFSERTHLDSKKRKTRKAHSLFGSPSLCSFSQEAEHFKNLISGIRYYNFSQDKLRYEQKISSSIILNLDGQNMPAVLRNLKKYEFKSFTRILNTLKEMNPYIKTANVHQSKTVKEFISFIENKLKRHVESWETSDGTLRGLAILLALETLPKNRIIIIEEPEQNLHPWAIKSLMSHIREVIEERRIQVILTTHSQQVLENANPEELRIVNRISETGTKVYTIKEFLPHHSIEMGEVGRLWVKGLLGGVPTYE